MKAVSSPTQAQPQTDRLSSLNSHLSMQAYSYNKDEEDCISMFGVGEALMDGAEQG